MRACDRTVKGHAPSLAYIVLIAMLAACSAGDDERTSTSSPTLSDRDDQRTSPPSPTPSDTGGDLAAASMLLDSSDFPEHWSHLPWDQDAIDDFRSNPAWAHCYASTLPGELDRAYAGEFSDTDTRLLSINPAVFVFDSPTSATRGVDLLIKEIECLVGAVGAGMDVDEQFAFGEQRLERLPAKEFNAMSAIRFVSTQTYKTLVPPDTDVLLFDVTYIVEGSIVSELTGFQRNTPIDPDLVREYTQLAHLKIQ